MMTYLAKFDINLFYVQTYSTYSDKILPCQKLKFSAYNKYLNHIIFSLWLPIFEFCIDFFLIFRFLLCLINNIILK